MSSRTLGELLYSLRKGDLLLPNFQRPFVWNPERWQSLIASILLEYPVGQALIGTEADSKTMSVRRPLSITEKKLGKIFQDKANLTDKNTKNIQITEYLQSDKANTYSCDFLLDGQQRLTSLDLIFGTAYHFAAGHELGRNQRLRWFLNLDKFGLSNLEWINTREMPHEEACDAFVYVKYKKTDKKSPYYHENSDSDLMEFCTSKKLQEQAGIENSVYLPLDKLFVEVNDEKSLKFDPSFLIDFFDERKRIIINRTKPGKSLLEKKHKNELDEEQYEKEFKHLNRSFAIWKSKLEAMLNTIIAFEFPVLEVPSKEFGRLAGIFSVINMGGVELSTFDLLVAKTTTAESSLRDVMKSSCKNSLKEFQNCINMLPEPARSKHIKDFWDIGQFLGEKNHTQIAQGEEFPESIARAYAQTIVLQSKLSTVLGTDWSIRNTFFNDYKKNAISILKLDDWGYSDKLILSLASESVRTIQEQAAKQLLRAYFFMKARLGITKLSFLPYRQMDLVLACVLNDSVWKQLQKDPNCTLMRKIQWWFWGSLFGGAYQKAHSSIDKRVLADIPRLLAYLSKPELKWKDVSNLEDNNHQNSQSNSFTEIPILGKNGQLGTRFEMICDVDGYSNQETLMTSANKTMGLAIRAFSLRNSLSDFKYRKKNSHKSPLKRFAKLHSGRQDLQADHLYAINAWYKFTGKKVERNEDHPVNSPLNFTYISAEANRYWSDHPSFVKLELSEALNDNQESIDFLNEHLLSAEALEHEYKAVILGSEENQKEKAESILSALLKKRFEKLRQAVLKENPDS